MATINDIISEVDELKPNQYDDELKIKWLSNLEGRIVDSVFKTHELEEEIEFEGYTDVSEELLVEAPYDELYKYYLMAMIDFNNSETDRYSNTSAMFNASYQAFANHYNKTHTPNIKSWNM